MIIYSLIFYNCTIIDIETRAITYQLVLPRGKNIEVFIKVPKIILILKTFLLSFGIFQMYISLIRFANTLKNYKEKL